VAYDTTALVASIKRRASVPTTQGLIDANGLLDVANEELLSYVMPLVVASQTERGVTQVDQAIAGASQFRFPTRAFGGNLREVQIIDNTSRFVNVPQISVDQLNMATFGFYLTGNLLNLWTNLQPLNTAWLLLRMTYYQRPSTLVYPSACGVVSSVNGAAVTLTGSPPAGFVSGALYDIVRASPGFECLATDVAGNVAGSVITLSSSAPTDLRPGDYLCLAGQSPVPQIPAELHPLLAQACAVKILQAVCDTDMLDAAMGILAKMEADAKALIAQRVDGEALRIVNRGSLFRINF
jgi:hypothetical protein